MTEISKREKLLNWICRILMIVDMLVILAGYISFFKIKSQLTSPLIPRDAAHQIFYDNNEVFMKAGIISGIIFLSGLWLYSFNKRILAIVMFCIVPICFKLLVR